MANIDANNLEEFKETFNADISQLADEKGEAPNQAFLELALDRLQIAGELDDPQICYIDVRGSNNKHIQIDGYCYDDADRSLNVFISNYADLSDDQPMNEKAINILITRMTNFVLSCYDGTFSKYCDPLEDKVRVSNEIGCKLRNKNTDDDILRIKFFIITNRSFSSRFKFKKTTDICEKDTSVVIWGLDRFYSLDLSGKEREPITIDFTTKYGLSYGLQCIEADISGSDKYKAFLCIIPGKILASIYSDYGSELLEQNVRSFLGEKSKYNRGIITTIKKEPDKFFIYNNGIAVTGKNLQFNYHNGQRYISSITDIQIINGGQTTASLYSQFRNDPDCLTDIYVPMKLTILKEEDGYEEVVSNISRYSNSQTKVSDADFFSSHPFHVAFETFSKSTPAPAKEGEIRDTYWYYERARGKYNQIMFKFTPAQKTDFQKKFPTKQRIKKEDLAKYYMTAKCFPYDVAKGRAKCMTIFAPLIDKIYKEDTTHSKINRQFFKDCISYAIMFQETDSIVANEPWYKTGGYKNIIVPYTIAKIINDCPSDMSIDYELIWKRQTMYLSLKDAVKTVAKVANDFFMHSPNNMLPTEYAKKVDAWNKFKTIDITYTTQFRNDLVRTILQVEKENEEAENQKISTNVQRLNMIFDAGSDYWNRLIKEGFENHLLTRKDSDLLNLAVRLHSSKPSYISERQAEAIWKIREKLGKEGIII